MKWGNGPLVPTTEHYCFLFLLGTSGPQTAHVPTPFLAFADFFCLFQLLPTFEKNSNYILQGIGDFDLIFCPKPS